MAPVIFLDVDGVLNALGGETLWGDDFEVELSPWGEGPFRLTLSKAMADALLSLDCEIKWVTTWQEEARLVGNYLGIDAVHLPLLRKTAWKRGAVNRFLDNTPRPWLWFEDDHGWMGTNNVQSFSTLPTGFLCNTDMLTGITPEQIELAREWIRENAI